MTTLHWIEKTFSAAAGPEVRDVARRYEPAPTIQLAAAAVLGAAGTWLVGALASLLPAGQPLNALAALAAGVAVPLAWLALDDFPRVRGLLRGVVAITVVVLAYQALGAGWAALGFAWTAALAWVVMDWIESGVTPVRLALTIAFAGQALLAFGSF